MESNGRQNVALNPEPFFSGAVSFPVPCLPFSTCFRVQASRVGKLFVGGPQKSHYRTHSDRLFSGYCRGFGKVGV